MLDVVQLVRDGKARIEWGMVTAKAGPETILLPVFRDAAKFDDVPALTWDYKPVPKDNTIYNGVRLPASAHQLQQIADLTNCMLMTPRVVDYLWMQSASKLPAVATVKGVIAAVSNITDVHKALEQKLADKGGDPGNGALIESVGKYWVLTNTFAYGKFGKAQACNYGWQDRGAPNQPCTPGSQKVWQAPGLAHNDAHWDPSQVIRLMYNQCVRISPAGEMVVTNTRDLLADPAYALALHHEGILKYFRQQAVPELPNTEVVGFYAPNITELLNAYLEKPACNT